MKNFKAFTIVELLVVMAVIGVLLSLAVFGIQALQKNQRETQRLQDLKNIQGSLESYYSKYRRYPVVNELIIDGSNFKITIGNSGPEFVTIPIQSLTPKFSDEGYDDITNCETNGLGATADTWWVMYHVGALNPNPQTYALFACTENEKTQNFGAKNDF
ncbi:MAG: type II secretion system protein [bacterium]